jgi:hypothetical protein
VPGWRGLRLGPPLGPFLLGLVVATAAFLPWVTLGATPAGETRSERCPRTSKRSSGLFSFSTDYFARPEATPSTRREARLDVVPTHVVDRVRALVFGLGCLKLQIEEELSWHMLVRS